VQTKPFCYHAIVRDGLALLLLLAGCDHAPPTIVGSTLLHDTFDVTGPYPIQTVVRVAGGVRSAEVLFTTSGSAQRIALARTQGDDHAGVYEGALPGPGRAARVRYFVVVTGNDGLIATDPESASIDTGPTYSFLALLCATDADCAPGQRCAQGECGARSCTTDLDCPTGLFCQSGKCAQRGRSCTSDADCLTTEICDREHAACVPR